MVVTDILDPIDLNAIQVAPDGRPIFMVFGNSLASQANTSQAATTTTATAAAAPGATSLVVASSAAFSVADKVAVGLYTGEVFTTTVAAVPDGTHLTLTDKLPKMVRAAANVFRYTTGRSDGIRQTLGTMSAALALLKNPVKLVQGYGYGGARGVDMLGDLALWLRRVRPWGVYLQLTENDISAGVSAAEIQRMLRAAVRLCIRHGAKPFVASPMPSNYTAGAQVAVFDTIRAYILTDMPAIAEFAPMVPINVSDAWQDTSAPTRRKPLVAWSTDGTHPIAEKTYAVGDVITPSIAASLPAVLPVAELIDMSITPNAGLTGTGGSTGGGGSFTGTAPNLWSVLAESGGAVTISRSVDNNLRLQFAVAGASNISTTRLRVTQTYNLPLNLQGGQMVRAVGQFKVNAAANLSMIYPEIVFSGGESYSSGQNTGNANDTTIVGKTIQIETHDVVVPDGATTMTVTWLLRPQTLGSPSGVSADIEVILLGVLPADNQVRGGLVLP